jgi:hypothetical protein
VTFRAQSHEPRTIGRRRIVRTAATLAWTVPAIQLATAVPALAASGCCNASLTGTAHWRANDLNYIDIPLQISNGCDTAVTGLTVMVTVCGIRDITYTGSQFLPVGWTQAGKANKDLDADGGGCYTLTFTTAQSLAANNATQPQLTVKSMAYVGAGHHRPAGTVTAVVSTAGCTSSPVVMSIPQIG